MGNSSSSLHVINEVAIEMKSAGVSSVQICSWKLRQLSLFDSQFKPIYESAIEEVREEIPSVPINVTEVGIRLGDRREENKYSARKINKYLIDSGLQYKQDRVSSKKKVKYDYRLTKLGKQYGKIEATTATNSCGTVYQVRWYDGVVEFLNNWLNAQTEIGKAS